MEKYQKCHTFGKDLKNQTKGTDALFLPPPLYACAYAKYIRTQLERKMWKMVESFMTQHSAWWRRGATRLAAPKPGSPHLAIKNAQACVIVLHTGEMPKISSVCV